MSWLSSWLHPGKAYDKGQEQLDKYYQQSQGYLNPYNQNGQQQYGNLNDYINNFKDPAKLQDEWSNNYKESDFAKNQESIAQEHGLNAASALGLNGSNTALNAIQRGTSQIGMEDKQNYLDQLMQKYLAGANLASGIYGQGANAAGQQSQNANQMGQNSAQMQYNKQQSGGNMINGLLGLAGGIAAGPVGGALAKRWNLSGGA